MLICVNAKGTFETLENTFKPVQMKANKNAIGKNTIMTHLIRGCVNWIKPGRNAALVIFLQGPCFMLLIYIKYDYRILIMTDLKI